MNIIIPMAGKGKRMRPHTLTTPKPLLPIAGKTIVQRLVEEISNVLSENIDEINFVIGEFGRDVEKKLLDIAASIGAKGRISHQPDPLGTAHAILCAQESLKGKVIVAYADTLFKANFTLDTKKAGVIWVKKVDDPSSFGVVMLDNGGRISGFAEKPEEHVSDLAIIGIYYFNDGDYLKKELQHLIDEGIRTAGEFGITDALQNMMQKGSAFHTDTVDEWLDCGNKDATVHTNQRILLHHKDKNLISPSADIRDSVILKPSYVGEGSRIINAVVGPYASIGMNTRITKSIVSNSIIQDHTSIINRIIDNSMVGNYVEMKGREEDLSIGDYTISQ